MLFELLSLLNMAATTVQSTTWKQFRKKYGPDIKAQQCTKHKKFGVRNTAKTAEQDISCLLYTSDAADE